MTTQSMQIKMIWFGLLVFFITIDWKNFYSHSIAVKIKTAEQISAVWRSSNRYTLDWKIHDFASPSHNGFAFSRHFHYRVPITKGKLKVTF